jgi:hypothetical protein
MGPSIVSVEYRVEHTRQPQTPELFVRQVLDSRSTGLRVPRIKTDVELAAFVADPPAAASSISGAAFHRAATETRAPVRVRLGFRPWARARFVEARLVRLDRVHVEEAVQRHLRAGWSFGAEDRGVHKASRALRGADRAERYKAAATGVRCDADLELGGGTAARQGVGHRRLAPAPSASVAVALLLSPVRLPAALPCVAGGAVATA